MERVKNKNVDVHEEKEKITFLYKVKDGKADRSYGIHVASLLNFQRVLLKEQKNY